MTPLRTIDKLTMAAARLKRAAPVTWSEFEQAFEALWAEHMVRCVQAASDQVLNHQGRAQNMSELRDTFRDCVATADKLEAKMKERK